jgi:aspartate/methionine/tyrosine aminotransferase
MFSSRVPSRLDPNRLARAVERFRASGRALIDLTDSNPTRAGFIYPEDLLRKLSDPEALAYAPAPRGLPTARAAVAADYARRGIGVPAEQVVVTASSSESYSMLFKVLCDPGDEVLVPAPSYPLFEHLTALEGVIPKSYGLDYHGSWSIDLPSLVRAMSPRTRAVVIVSPNNPTGSYVRKEQLDAVGAECARWSAALLADEVFADYELAKGAAACAGVPLRRKDVLTFGLGGLSKTAGLPQVKLGWIAAAGPASLVDQAMIRLELVADTYLSVSTPVQHAAGDLFIHGASIRAQIQARIEENLHALLGLVAGQPALKVLEPEGGWSAVLQVPTFRPEEELVIGLLAEQEVLVHPGYFFDFPRESFLVVSLLPPASQFAEGIERILRHFDCNIAPRLD